MISVGPGRATAGCGGWQSVVGIGQRHAIHGRQGKSAASGRVPMVGRLEFHRPFSNRAGWRFTSKREQFQRPKRHPTLLRPASAP
jgi:hypothetical protein